MAIKSLESLGRVEARVGSGTYIRDSSHVLAGELTRGLEFGWPFLHQLQAARSPIEFQILEEAFSHRSPENMARLQAVVDARQRQLAEEDPREGVPNLNLTFEATLGEICGNEVLRRLQVIIHATWVQALVALGEAPGDRVLLQQEHDQVLKCFRAGDLPGALAAYREHLRVGHADRRSLSRTERQSIRSHRRTLAEAPATYAARGVTRANGPGNSQPGAKKTPNRKQM
jgi:GntR family transcriptional repressor for pyruvate dehydrogenase complex